MEYGEKRGLERGLAQGRLEGEKKANLKIAKNLKVKNSPISFIMEVTGLSKGEIEKL